MGFGNWRRPFSCVLDNKDASMVGDDVGIVDKEGWLDVDGLEEGWYDGVFVGVVDGWFDG